MSLFTKSIRLNDSSPVIASFVSQQSNFSKAIKYLIYDYCSKHEEIEDLSKKMQSMQDFLIMENMRSQRGAESVDVPEAATGTEEAATAESVEVVEPEASVAPEATQAEEKPALKKSRGRKKATTAKKEVKEVKEEPEDENIASEYSEYGF